MTEASTTLTRTENSKELASIGYRSESSEHRHSPRKPSVHAGLMGFAGPTIFGSIGEHGNADCLNFTNELFVQLHITNCDLLGVKKLNGELPRIGTNFRKGIDIKRENPLNTIG